MDEVQLLDYLKGELCEEAAWQVEAWCEASVENRRLLEQLYCTTFIGDCATVMNTVDVEGSLSKLKVAARAKERAVEKRPLSRWRRYVAPLVAFWAGVVFVVGLTYPTLSRISDYVVATGSGERAQFILPDGTKVWLNASTRLNYESSLWRRERRVHLTGEAYFEVTPDERAPFVVESKNVETRVLGTKFNVRARSLDEKVVTTLLQGSVRVNFFQKDHEAVILKPGQTLLLNTATLQTKLTESSAEQDLPAWVRGKFSFVQAPFEEIAQCLEQYFDVRICIEDERLKSECFTCELRTDDTIEGVLSVLALTKHLRYKVGGEKVYVYAY